MAVVSPCSADLVVLDLSMRIEQIAAEHPDAHVILSADVSQLDDGCAVTNHSCALLC